MLETFIKRPILSLVISLLFVLVGVLALLSLPVTQFPDIVPPSVTVTANYTGANSETVVKAVTTPIERAVNGVPGMTYMTSMVNNNGLSVTTIYFKVGTDPDIAAVTVQTRVSSVLDELPPEVIRAGVITEKEVNAMLLYLNLTSEDPNTDERFIYNFADINVLPELKRIEGVGFADIMGQREYAMRIWLKPDRLAVYNVSPEEVIEAIRAQNLEAAPGKSGESDGRIENTSPLQYTLRYTGKFTKPDEYANIVIRSENNGAVLKLKDVARIELNSVSYEMIARNNGNPAASILIKQRPGSNANEVIKNIKAKMAELKGTTFPPGMNFSFSYDVSRFLDASIHEVLKTLIEAFFLVSLVVFIFLQDWRSTLISVLAIPVAIVGTFAFMPMLGFSINLLTLFALVLAIGIVVDNAIVVVEAIHAKMEEDKVTAMEATLSSMKDIAAAIIAITLVMSAVFIPVAFMSGPVGIFYRQFSLTLAIAIVISGINALTLTPALCAILLKPHHHSDKKSWLDQFFIGFNNWYEGLSARYQSLLALIVSRRTVTIGLLIGFLALSGWLGKLVPTGFIPTEDQSMVYVNVVTPPGATVERTEKILNQLNDLIKKEPEVESVTTLAGYSLLTETPGANLGMAMVNLKSWEARTRTVNDLIQAFDQKADSLSDAEVEFFAPPTVPGFGNASGFELRLIERIKSDNLQKMARTNQTFLTALGKHPALGAAFSSFNPNFPQYLIHIDQDQAAKKKVTSKAALDALQAYIGSFYASNFIRFGQMYKVMVQAGPEYRKSPDDLLGLFVKNEDGEMIQMSSFVRLERVYGPDQISRYNMYTSALINGDAGKGFSSGDAIAAIEEVAAKTLPKGYAIEFSGMTREQILSGGQTTFIFIVCLIFVYLILAGQYESFLLPLPVLLSLPTGIIGAYGSLLLVGLENNIYAQVSLIMLIGLLGKNAILIVEFANLQHKQGAGILDATLEGAKARLRPILMTSFAFVAGLIPLTIATGAGALGNRSIGTAAAGGMLIGTIGGLIVIPGLYFLFASLSKKRDAYQIPPETYKSESDGL